LSLNYETREQIIGYLKRYPRKFAGKLMLLGYQAISGSENPIIDREETKDDSQAIIDAKSANIREQNKPGTSFNQRNIK